MKPKTSAHYQREYRKRLREQGLVKREVWIHPKHASLLSKIEKQLRETHSTITTDSVTTGVNIMTDNVSKWTTVSLHEALKESDLFSGARASVEIIEGVDPTLHIIMHEYGDLPVFLTVSGEQIIVESVLWSKDDINDTKGFNDFVLRTHKYFPLSTISLDSMSNGQDYYHMFGALSSTSILPNVIFEIEALTSNVIQATSVYSGFLKMPVEA